MKNELILAFDDRQKEQLIEFYRDKISNVEAELNALIDALNQIKASMGQSATTTNVNVEPETMDKMLTHRVWSDYSVKWKWPRKIYFALSENGRCLSTRGIINYLNKYEDFKKDPINSISGTLSAKIKKGSMINRYKIYDDGDYYFGLLEWFDSEGNIKDEYRAI